MMIYKLTKNKKINDPLLGGGPTIGGCRDSVRAIVQLYDQIHFTIQRFARITR